MYSWNKCYNMIMRIKKDYIKTYKDGILNVEHWVKQLGINEYKEFLEPLQLNHHDKFVLIRYGLAEMQRGMWEDPESVYRHCRSTVIDLENEELILHPYTKFFNLNEVEETRLENILTALEKAKVVEIANKLDGSLYSARKYKENIFTSTSMALTEDNSWRLADANRMLKECGHTQKMIHENPNYTFVFEYISLKDAHVVLYKEDEEGIYLIGITDMTNGKELNYKEIIDLAKKYNVKSTEIENVKFESLLGKSKEIQAHEKEGWVINIDGHRFKVKGDDYVHLHRVLDSISSINVVIESIAEDKYDDLISKVPDAYRSRVEKFAEKVFEWKIAKEKEIEDLYNKAPKEGMKEFMIWVDNNVEKDIRGYLRSKYLGKEINILKVGKEGYKKAKDIFGETAEQIVRGY